VGPGPLGLKAVVTRRRWDVILILNNIHYYQVEKAQFKNAALNRTLSPLQLMYMSRRLYNEIGIQEEIERMLDLLWEFNKDIQNFVFPEVELYKWDFKYGIDSWKKLLEMRRLFKKYQ
jgi:hypothetical protein